MQISRAMKILISAVALTVVVITMATGLAEATPKPKAPNLEAFLADRKPELLELAQLMYSLGVCESHVKKSDADYYINEFIAGSPGSSDEFLQKSQLLFSKMYAQGRLDAAKLHLDETQCQRVFDKDIAGVRTARRAQKY